MQTMTSPLALPFRAILSSQHGSKRWEPDEAEAVLVTCRVLQPSAEGAREALRGAEVRHEARQTTARCHVGSDGRTGMFVFLCMQNWQNSSTTLMVLF